MENNYDARERNAVKREEYLLTERFSTEIALLK